MIIILIPLAYKSPLITLETAMNWTLVLCEILAELSTAGSIKLALSLLSVVIVREVAHLFLLVIVLHDVLGRGTNDVGIPEHDSNLFQGFA